MVDRRIANLLCAGAALLVCCGNGLAQGNYRDPGISDTEISIGVSYPYSGPAAAYGVIAEGVQAQFDLINSRGGINGRKLKLKVLDDAYQPSKMVTNVRQLVEQEKVFAIFNTGGTAHNIAISEYLAKNGVPQLFINTGATVFASEVDKFPWAIAGIPDAASESTAFAEYIKRTKPGAKVGILYQADSFGNDFLEAFEKAAARNGVQVILKEGYNPSEPSVDTQVSKLARAGADTMMLFAIPKFVSQAIQKAAEISWKPLIMVTANSNSAEMVLKPAGYQASQGVVSSAYLKDPSDPKMANDPGVKEYLAAMKAYAPKGNPVDPLRVRGWANAQMLVAAIQNMKAPTRAALRDAAFNMDSEITMLLPGMRIKTSPTNKYPYPIIYIEKFEGERWVVDPRPITIKR